MKHLVVVLVTLFSWAAAPALAGLLTDICADGRGDGCLPSSFDQTPVINEKQRNAEIDFKYLQDDSELTRIQNDMDPLSGESKEDAEFRAFLSEAKKRVNYGVKSPSRPSGIARTSYKNPYSSPSKALTSEQQDEIRAILSEVDKAKSYHRSGPKDDWLMPQPEQKIQNSESAQSPHLILSMVRKIQSLKFLDILMIGAVLLLFIRLLVLLFTKI